MGKVVVLFLTCLSWSAWAQVGINTTDPQEQLHISSTTGTLRVESLNATNNIYNAGDTDNDGEMSNNTYPLYVDEFGDFTLELKVLLNSEATDALDDTALPNSAVELLGTDNDGVVTTVIKSYTITLNRPTLLEAKYAISHNIYEDNTYTIIDDLLARRVTNYIKVSPDPDLSDGIVDRKYGPSSKSYTSGSQNSVEGPYYNGHTVYIKFEQAGTYTIDIVGEVSSNVKWSGASGTQSRPTYVEFAVAEDFLFFRLH